MVYTYTYDLVGNRTAVFLNGTPVQQPTFNAANQIIGWAYDEAGNLTNDGSTTYEYDALHRLIQQGTTTNVYNGDGVLVAQDDTRYTQDLAAALPQVLADDSQTYLYGRDRLAAQQGATRTWYASVALGSGR